MRRFAPYTIYSALVGVLYGLYGVGEAMTSLGYRVPLPLLRQGEIVISFLMLLISSLYLYRIPHLYRGEVEGVSFLLMALILSTIAGTMYFLIIGASYLDSIIVGEEFSLSSTEINLPLVALFVLSLPLWLTFRYRKEVKG
ncbi:MAG: hypothetical protein J7L88_05570 [Thermoplasmata archaeon]|nr:hypothetical protein [Thermoplasmata archaeon]